MKFDWSRSIDPAYLFGYGIYKGSEYLYNYHSRKIKHAEWMNSSYKNLKDLYNDRSLDAYEYRDRHSEDPIVGYWWKKANERDLYEEKKQYQEDFKKNTGYNWRDNAYPRSAYGGAFAGTGGSRKSPLFEVNDAIMELYNGVKKW